MAVMENERHGGYGNVLLIRFSAIGDVAISVPVVQSLAHAFPDTRFTVLTSVRFLPFFKGLPANVSLVGVDLRKDYHGRGGVRRLFRMLKPMGFDAVADLHGVLRTYSLGMMFRLHGVPVRRIRKNRLSRYRLTRFHFKDLSQRPTSAERYCKVLERLGFRFQVEFRPIFPPGGADISPVSSFTGGKDSPWIGVAPFAAHKGKMYPESLTREVMLQLLKAHPQARIFLFGRGQAEDKLFSRWCAELPQCLNVGQHLENMQQELILMSHLDVMLSMDSANMHLASLTATPVVSIWGATHPYAGFLGWNQPEENIIQIDDLRCRPCSIYGQRPCHRGDYACLTQILPDRIVERILSIISNPQKQ